MGLSGGHVQIDDQVLHRQSVYAVFDVFEPREELFAGSGGTRSV